MDNERWKKKSVKKSMSASPLYRSTLDDVVDEDNVVLITDELKVFVSTSSLYLSNQCVIRFYCSCRRKWKSMESTFLLTSMASKLEQD